MLVDSHCHLDYPGLIDDLPGVLARARNAGIGHLLAIGTKMRDFPRVRAIAEQYAQVHCSVGIHPHEAANEEAGLERLVETARHPRVVAIGETGLDYYYDKSPRPAQQANFRTHIAAARATNLPLIVHTRDADQDTASILREGCGQGGLRGVLHCFTSSQWLAEQALELGFLISISGIVTFKNAKDLQQTVKAIPLDRLMVETDAPYLAPVPMRGRPCEPAFVAHTAAKVAELKGVSLDALAHATTANFFALFEKARPIAEAA
jgi:TatD DNase family protein